MKARPPPVRRLTPTAPPAPHPFAFPIAGALGRSSPLPPGEGGRVRVHIPERLRPLAQEAVDEGGLAGPVRTGEEDEVGILIATGWLGCGQARKSFKELVEARGGVSREFHFGSDFRCPLMLQLSWERPSGSFHGIHSTWVNCVSKQLPRPTHRILIVAVENIFPRSRICLQNRSSVSEIPSFDFFYCQPEDRIRAARRDRCGCKFRKHLPAITYVSVNHHDNSVYAGCFPITRKYSGKLVEQHPFTRIAFRR